VIHSRSRHPKVRKRASVFGSPFTPAFGVNGQSARVEPRDLVFAVAPLLETQRRSACCSPHINPAPEARKRLAQAEASEREAVSLGKRAIEDEPRRGDTKGLRERGWLNH
jgi:hypothetical protein